MSVCATGKVKEGRGQLGRDIMSHKQKQNKLDKSQETLTTTKTVQNINHSKVKMICYRETKLPKTPILLLLSCKPSSLSCTEKLWHHPLLLPLHVPSLLSQSGLHLQSLKLITPPFLPYCSHPGSSLCLSPNTASSAPHTHAKGGGYGLQFAQFISYASFHVPRLLKKQLQILDESWPIATFTPPTQVF